MLDTIRQQSGVGLPGMGVMEPGVQPFEPFGPDSLDESFGFGGDLDAFGPDILDVSFKAVPQGQPIQLTGEERRKFEFRFRTALENAIVKMGTIHREAKHDRNVYRMMPRAQEYAGQPNITMPISANKADGVLSHLRDALEQRPPVSFTPEGVGKGANMAAQTAPLCEAVMEREINRSGSREVIMSDLPREAVITGTGIARLSVAEHSDGELFVQVSECVRLENFFVDQISARNLANVFCAYRRKYRLYELMDMAEEGYLDGEGLTKLRQFTSTGEEVTAEEREKHFIEDMTLQEENVLHTIFYGYMRYRKPGDRRSALYEVVYHRPSMTFLAIRENPYGRAFDAPPLGLVRVGKMTGYLFGRGIVRRLHAMQQIADNAMNNHLALNNLSANPPFLYRANSPFGRFLERNGQFGLRAGVGIPTYSSPEVGDVKVMEFPNPRLNLEDVSIAQGMASQATFTEEAIGAPTQGRRTLGQFQIEVQKGTIRLRTDLTDLAYDLGDLMRMYWAMTNAFKIEPNGIIEVSERGKLLASRTISAKEVIEQVQSILLPMLSSGRADPMEFEAINEELNAMLTGDTIPSSRRSDLTISMTGTKIIADKTTDLQMLLEFTPFLTSLFEAAKQDSFFNYHLRSIASSMGFKDIEKRVPPDPGTFIEDPAQRMALTQGFNELFSRMSMV